LYREWREGRIEPEQSTCPAPDDPNYHPKILGACAFHGALLVGAFTVPIVLLVHSPGIAIALIVGMWALLLVIQLVGWHHYFFVIKPAQARLALARAKSEELRIQLAESRIRQKIENRERQAALAEYQAAFQEGTKALEQLKARAKNLADQKRVLQATLDFGKAQRMGAEEADIAKRSAIQAKAMRQEVRRIQNIILSF